MNTYVITGASSGLGLEIAKQLLAMGKHVINISKELPAEEVKGLSNVTVDLANGSDAHWAAGAVLQEHLAPDGRVDCLINCAGVNHITYLEKLTLEDWWRLQDTNVTAAVMLSQRFLPHLEYSKGTILNIISNASHMPMTASIAYNASKAALHMVTLQMARELTKRKGITVFGISPNKMRGTGMSKYIEAVVPEVRGWTPEYAAQYQTNGLLTGKETEPAAVAEFICFLLQDKAHHEALSGCVLPYGA